MTETGQNFTLYEGMAKELVFTVTGVDDAADITEALWTWHGVTKTLEDGISAEDSDGDVLVTVRIEPEDTEDLVMGVFSHQLIITDGDDNPDMVATGTGVLRDTIYEEPEPEPEPE